jgi:hypothetical protein
MHVAKKYFVWIWVFALFTATAGISFEQIYCYCLGKTIPYSATAHIAQRRKNRKRHPVVNQKPLPVAKRKGPNQQVTTIVPIKRLKYFS